MAMTPALTALDVPEIGTVTWDSEGSEGGRYHSRRPHVPSASSGLTIGRGYDMKSRTGSGVLVDLLRAGVPRADAERLARGAGLQGEAAKRFLRENGLEGFEITPAAQRKLFEIAYDAEAAEAMRLATKADVRAKYGEVDWERLDPAIREMLIDMKFRGDYTPAARARIQKYVVANDLVGFARTLCDREHWPGVPQDRFDRRKRFLEEAVAERRAAGGVREKRLPGSEKPGL